MRFQSGLDGRLLDLMRQCWDEFPTNRPTAHDVKSRLNTILKEE